jgi:CubicO group peptidase (beta-lactamase class C family)
MMTLTHASRVLEAAVAGRVFPGAIVEVGNRARALASVSAGHLTYDTTSPRVEAGTVYDLASLTKVLAAAAMAMELVDAGRLALEDEVGRWSPAWQGLDRRTVLVRDLLEHSSGLPAHRRYFETLKGRASFETAIAHEPLAYPPRTASVYSDAGFMLLGFILERAAAIDLARWFHRWKMQAIGADPPLAFLPPDSWHPRIAPTEDDPWRGRVLIGDVHDENASALGGVAAHAGLFGTASAVGAAARWWMGLIAGEDRPEARAATARRFATRSLVPGSSRALGWDTMLTTSSCGTRMSPAAIGHTGFTGTSLWIDPVRDVYVVFLSNRVHPTREGEAMKAIRPALHDAVAEDLSV